MIRQSSNGKPLNTVMVSGSVADLTAICGVLEGKCEIMDLKSQGGVEEVIPTLNMLKFSVGKKYIGGMVRSVAVTLPHLNPLKTLSDITAAVKGIWNADTTTADKCSYVNGVGSNSRG